MLFTKIRSFSVIIFDNIESKVLVHILNGTVTKTWRQAIRGNKEARNSPGDYISVMEIKEKPGNVMKVGELGNSVNCALLTAFFCRKNGQRCRRNIIV